MPNRTVLTYINVNVGDHLGGNVDAALSAGTGGKICITVPTAADRVSVGSSRGGVLHTGGCHYTN